ncbi:MAG: hypothetical protein ACKOCT_00770 [Alphaproteobacteria bacterium]
MAPAEEALLVLAVRGPLRPTALAAALGLGEGVALELVEEQVRQGLVEHDASGRVRLTGAGSTAAGATIARERHALGPETASLAERFDDLNRRVKAAITDWQVVRVGSAVVPNDHSDPRRDAAVLDRLAQAGAAAGQLLRPLSRARRRIAVLLSRLDEALSRAVAGGGEWVCGLGVESVHAVWWNLHAELLALLGRERGEADA